MKDEHRYRFVYSPFFLGLMTLLLLVSSVLLSPVSFYNTRFNWIPLLAGFVNLETLSPALSVFLSLSFHLITVILLYRFNEKLFTCGKSSLQLAFTYLVFALTPESTIFFSGSSIAAPLLMSSIYFSLLSKDDDNNLSIAAFLISLATMFNFLLVFMIPVILFYSLQSSSFELRKFVLSILVVLMPYIFVVSIRHLIFGDASIFLELLWTDIASVSAPAINAGNLADIVLIISFVVVFYRSVISVGKVVNRYKTLKYSSILRNIMVFLFLSLISLFYPAYGTQLFVLISIPMSLLIYESVSMESNLKARRAEFFVLMIFIAISRIAHFI